jgi:hypothetical protein
MGQEDFAMGKSRFATVTISILPEALAVVDEFAQVAGLSRSAVIQGFIDGALPTLKTAAQTLRELNKLDEEKRKALSARFDELTGKADAMEGEAGALARSALAAVHKAKFKP